MPNNKTEYSAIYDELNNMRRTSFAFLNSDYASGYRDAVRNIENAVDEIAREKDSKLNTYDPNKVAL